MRHALLLGTCLIAASCPPSARAGLVTDTFCGPSSGMGCETPADKMVWLQKAKDVTVGFGNIGTPGIGMPLMKVVSDGGMLNMFVDLANGFATITPAKPGTTFNGLDFSIPGFEFSHLVFDVQLTPVSGQTQDSFSVTARTAGLVDQPVGGRTDMANQDAEYSITALGGAFDDVNILATGGFDEVKHIEVSGVCQIQSSGTCTPVMLHAAEPASLAIFASGLLALGFAFRRASR